MEISANFIPYSLVWMAGILLVVVGVVLLTNKPRPVDWLAFGGITLALLAAWFVLRPVATPLSGNAAELQKMIGQGTPTLVEFQSPY